MNRLKPERKPIFESCKKEGSFKGKNFDPSQAYDLQLALALIEEATDKFYPK
jgi:hypothetical protein